MGCDLDSTPYFGFSTNAQSLDLHLVLQPESFIFDFESYRKGEANEMDWKNIKDWKEIDGEPEQTKKRSELETLFDLCSSP